MRTIGILGGMSAASTQIYYRELCRLTQARLGGLHSPELSRPAVATERLTLTAQGNIRYALKSPYRDGTTHVEFEPLDFLSRLAALVPSPRVNLTRFHGVFAPHHAMRKAVVARAPSGVGPPGQGGGAARQGSMHWAERLSRVFGMDVSSCERCGGGAADH